MHFEKHQQMTTFDLLIVWFLYDRNITQNLYQLLFIVIRLKILFKHCYGIRDKQVETQ